MTGPDVADRSDAELLDAIIEAGSLLLQSGKAQLASLGQVDDDPRWNSPVPLRFDLQLATLFLGALDSYDVTASLLRARASQQAFNVLRFQLETLALIRWMSEPPDEAGRRIRAYRVACGQLRRAGRFLLEDAGKNREALELVHGVRAWGRRLQEIAAEDGIASLKGPPGRRDMLQLHGHTGGYPTFSMYSELGSHPGASGNLLFSLEPEATGISYDLQGALVMRAFFVAAAIMYLWSTCETVANALGWTKWLREATEIYTRRAGPLMMEASKRRREAMT
jgi:hypothetical protein